jgi:hypothetical protein
VLYDVQSIGAQAYIAVAHELIARETKHSGHHSRAAVDSSSSAAGPANAMRHATNDSAANEATA